MNLPSGSNLPTWAKNDYVYRQQNANASDVWTLSPRAVTPDVTSTLKLDVQPGRAAVFLDGKFVGHASEFGGVGHSMLLSPGKHRIKVELPGYRTFETEVNLIASQKSEVKTELMKGSIEQAGPEIKQPQ